jgi:hypothetical protein
MILKINVLMNKLLGVSEQGIEENIWTKEG